MTDPTSEPAQTQPTQQSSAQQPPLTCSSSAPGPPAWPAPSRPKKPVSRVVVVDKGCLCNSLFHYPAHMTFFTTSERLEIGGIPFPATNAKPTRNEALEYYRLVAAYYKLDVRQYHRVKRVAGADGDFAVHTEDRFGRPGLIAPASSSSPPATTTCPT